MYRKTRDRSAVTFLAIVYTICAIVHLLLPVQTGLPSIGPVHVTSLTLGVAFMILLLARTAAIHEALRDRFTVALITFAFLATFMTYIVNGRPGTYEGWEQLPLVATNTVMGYVVNLAMVRTLGARLIFRILLIVGTVAAFLLLIEGMLGYRLPPYHAIMLLQLSRGVDLFSSRAVGPLGNSLISSLEMGLLALIAMAECRGLIRALIVFVAISGALLTGSKTALVAIPVIAGVLLHGILRDPDVRAARVKVGIGIVILIGAIGLLLSAGPNTPIIGTLVDRVAGSQKDLSDLGAEIRQNALIHLGIDQLLNDPSHFLFGRGAGSAGVAMKELQGNNTVDNMYLAVAYDYGIPTALLYLFALLGPFAAATDRGKRMPYYVWGGVVIVVYGLSFNVHLVTTVMFMITAFGARCRSTVPK
ncbi:MAG: O-antigen ligase domain-containing protein [Verrucomicrobiaceae bacterium]|nr:MAG: O-antigen ligase domain-containing protein [Verrucomicrobiaceae bacterium]